MQNVLDQIKLEWMGEELEKDVQFQHAAGRLVTGDQEKAYKAGYMTAVSRLCAEIRRLERLNT